MTGTGISPWLSILTVMTMLLVLAIPVGLVLVIVGLVQYFRPVPQAVGPEDTLKHRYAAGEISLSEYEEMLRTLRGEQS
ncbi:MAG: SHOCT domain-containing protein [Thermaerobacter sp.]|nr:SHOCT domain-containing protein [Thermaerobacter sp.]